jgi:hypothetical protein
MTRPPREKMQLLEKRAWPYENPLDGARAQRFHARAREGRLIGGDRRLRRSLRRQLDWPA